MLSKALSPTADMARPKKDAAANITAETAATTAIVHSAPGLNLRKFPALNAPVIRILRDGEQITIDSGASVPGWKAVAGGGFVMAQFVK